MMHKQSLLSLAGSLALTLGAVAQDNRKIPTPLPPVDLDHKVSAPVGPAASTTPKNEDQRSARTLRQQTEPAKGVDLVTLPNGRQFRAVRPHDQVVYDHPTGDAIWADGVGYKASFAGTGFTYVPYFGVAAPQAYPLTLALESARLGEMVTPLSVATPLRQGDTVTLDRGTVLERYELSSSRIEQKFVIATPFVGDLTLTLRVTSELQASRDEAGIRFANTHGHVGYSNAVLVDALGRRTAMTTDYSNGHITLRAPASTLANAAFPVTVDPVVVTFAVDTNVNYVLTNPDIAFSNASGNYLVVYTRIFSATDKDLWAMAVDTAGTVVGGSFTLLDNTTDSWDDGRVAVCGGNFLGVASRLAFGGGTRAIWGRTRAVGATTMGAQFQISGTESGDKVSPDVGGEFEGPVNFCVVWQRNFSGRFRLSCG